MAPSRRSRYARAFISAVLSRGDDETVRQKNDENHTFSRLLQGSVELQRSLESRAVTAAEKRAVISQLCARLAMGTETRNLLFILSDRHLLQSYPAVVEAIDALLEKRAGMERVKITSSRELESEEKSTLMAQIEAFRHSNIVVMYSVDAAVLGGIRMEIGTTVWEGTLKGKLDRLLQVLSAAKAQLDESADRPHTA